MNSLHIQRMKRVIKIIEEGLDDDISVAELSNVACYSSFHFHRVFKAFCGENIYAFRKRLLLERSVKSLLHSGDSITDIAFNSGYGNQSSFNKAFKKMFGVTPSKCRKEKLSFTQYSYIVKEIKLMKVDIRSLKPIPVISVRKKGDYKSAANQAWQALMSFTYSNRLMTKETESIGICYDDPKVTEPENIRYNACVTYQAPIKFSQEVEEGVIEEDVIEGGLYAVFLHSGSYDNLKDTYATIFNQWLPESDYRLRELPPFEKYLNRDPRRTKPENLRTEIYIPITKG